MTSLTPDPEAVAARAARPSIALLIRANAQGCQVGAAVLAARPAEWNDAHIQEQMTLDADARDTSQCQREVRGTETESCLPLLCC